MSGEFDSRKGSQSTKFERRPRIFVKLSFKKGAYIKYVGGGAGGFYKFFKKYFVPQETIDLNISWPLPSILVSYLRLACSSISG